MKTSRRIGWTAALALALAGCANGARDDEAPAFDVPGSVEQAAGVTCVGTNACSGSGAVYTSAMRAGTTLTNRQELLQTFRATANGVPSSVSLAFRNLRRFTAATQPALHVAVYGPTSATVPQVSGDPLVEGTTGAATANGTVEVALEGTGALVSGGTYALLVWADGLTPTDTGSVLVGVGSLVTPNYADGGLFMRARRRALPTDQWGLARFRPETGADLAFAFGPTCEGGCTAPSGPSWSTPITSSEQVMPASQTLKFPPTAPAYDAQGQFTGQITMVRESRMMALSPTRVAVLSEQRFESPLRDNIYTYRFAYLSDEGTGATTPVTSPTEPPALAGAYDAAGGGDNFGARVTNTDPTQEPPLNYNVGSADPADFRTVAAFASHLNAVERTVTITKSRPEAADMNVGYLTLYYPPAVGEQITMRLTSYTNAWTYTVQLESSVRGVNPAGLDHYANFYWGTMVPGDWMTFTFGEGAREYTANADGSLTVSTRAAYRLHPVLDNRDLLQEGNTYWNSYGLRVTSAECGWDAALPPQPPGTLSGEWEGLVTTFDVAADDTIARGDSLFLFEPGIENSQSVALGPQTILYASSSDGSDAHLDGSHIHVGLVKAAADGTLDLTSRLWVTVPDQVRMGYYASTIQRLSDTDAAVFWNVELPGDFRPNRFVITHVRVVNGALTLVANHLYDPMPLGDAEMLTALPGSKSLPDALAQMLAAAGSSFSQPVTKSDASTAVAFSTFLDNAITAAAADEWGAYANDGFTDAAGTSHSRWANVERYRGGPDEVAESSARLPDGRAVFYGWTNRKGYRLSASDQQIAAGASTTTNFEYERWGRRGELFIVKLQGDGSLQVTRQKAWENFSSQQLLTRAENGEETLRTQYDARELGADVDLYEGGLVASERGVVAHDDNLDVFVPIAIDAAGNATVGAIQHVFPYEGAYDVGNSDCTPLVYMGGDQFAGVYYVRESGAEIGQLSLLTFAWDGGAVTLTNRVPLKNASGTVYQSEYGGDVVHVALDAGRLVFAARYSSFHTGEPGVPGGEAYRDSALTGVITAP